MPWCTTRPPRVRELVGVFGCCCCVNWCVTSLVWGSVRVLLAVQRLAQHATSCSTAQHLCVLKHNTTTGITHIPSIVLAALGGQHCGSFGVICLEIVIKVWLIFVTYLRSGKTLQALLFSFFAFVLQLSFAIRFFFAFFFYLLHYFYSIYDCTLYVGFS